jgi:hypothetical protein
MLARGMTDATEKSAPVVEARRFRADEWSVRRGKTSL